LTDPFDLSALDLGREIEAGRIDPLEITDVLLSRIEVEDPDHLIYVRTCRERAMIEAGAARDRARRGLRLSPLDGVPISWKDLFDTAGIETSGGSALLAGRVPVRDAQALTRLSAAGTICVGKTNMTELAFSGLGINPITGTPPNPHDPGKARCPGGSSSGAAVSVARRLAFAARGSDTGGSIRLPAAWCGIVGFKPTYGSLPMDGVLPLQTSFDTIGPLTRTVSDAAALFSLLRDGRVRPLVPADISRCRLYVAGAPVDQDMEPDVADQYRKALDHLQAAGAHLTFGPWPEASEALEAAAALAPAESFAQWGALIDSAPHKMSAQLLSRFGGGRAISSARYLTARAALAEIVRRHRERVAGFDAVIMPTVVIAAPEIAPLTAEPDLFAAVNLLALRNTRIVNLLGLPAVTVPAGKTAQGLPVGLTLVGCKNSNFRLLGLGRALEQVFFT